MTTETYNVRVHCTGEKINNKEKQHEQQMAEQEATR